MPYTISKEFHFSASHILDGLPDGHPCGRLHGHNYRVDIELSAPILDDIGFVLDYGELAVFRAYLDDHLDHRHLNERLQGNPTAEHLARHLYEWAAGRGWPVTGVGVSETPKTWAWWRP